jgi:hypothetical protein
MMARMPADDSLPYAPPPFSARGHMHTRQDVFESLCEVQAFIQDNPAKLGGIVNGSIRRKLDGAIAELPTVARIQAINDHLAKRMTRKHHALRQVLLRDHMATIAGVARLELPHSQAFARLRVPSQRSTATTLSIAAHAMALAAAPFSDVFIAAGLPADFITQLTNTADAMIATLHERSRIVSRRREATMRLRVKLTAARRMVNALDGLVRSALADDPALCASWDTAKQVQIPRRAEGSHD